MLLAQAEQANDPLQGVPFPCRRQRLLTQEANDVVIVGVDVALHALLVAILRLVAKFAARRALFFCVALKLCWSKRALPSPGYFLSSLLACVVCSSELYPGPPVHWSSFPLIGQGYFDISAMAPLPSWVAPCPCPSISLSGTHCEPAAAARPATSAWAVVVRSRGLWLVVRCHSRLCEGRN